VATTKRVIDAQPGPAVVVGHSYGGVAMTGAAAGNPKVKALVYLAAFAPEAGEPVGAFLEKYPSLLGTGLAPDSAGFIYIDRSKFNEIFARDVNPAEQRVMAAAQRPLCGEIFGQSVSAVAWKDVPSWYLVSTQDNALNPDLERYYAKRMGATTSEIAASHVAFVSHPDVAAKLIKQAAQSVA